MTHPNLDELDRVRFVWPEPLVIELICDQYGTQLPAADRMAVAKLHEHMLRGLVEDTGSDGAAQRRQLTARWGACGLDSRMIAKIEEAVFFELIRLVGMRFRNSPRLREAYGARLKTALAHVPAVPLPEVKRAEIKRAIAPRLVPAPMSRWRARVAAVAA